LKSWWKAFTSSNRLYIILSTAIGILPLIEAKNCYIALIMTALNRFLGWKTDEKHSHTQIRLYIILSTAIGILSLFEAINDDTTLIMSAINGFMGWKTDEKHSLSPIDYI